MARSIRFVRPANNIGRATRIDDAPRPLRGIREGKFSQGNVARGNARRSRCRNGAAYKIDAVRFARVRRGGGRGLQRAKRDQH